MKRRFGKIFNSFRFFYFYLPVILVLIFFTVTFSFVIYQIQLQANQKIFAKINIESVKYQNDINILSSKKLNQVKDIAQFLSSYNLLPEYKRREVFSHYLREVAYTNDDIYSIWTVFKPYSIDKFDKDYSSDIENLTGQYVYTLYKVKQHIDTKNVDELDYKKLTTYIKLFKLNQSAIIIAPVKEPNFELTGVKYVIRFIAPIITENEIVGIIGIDIDYRYLSRFFPERKNIFLLNDNFGIIYSNDIKKVGSNFFDLYVSVPNIEDIYAKFSLKKNYSEYGKFILPEKVFYNVKFFSASTTNNKWAIVNIKNRTIKKEMSNLNIATIIIFFLIGVFIIILALYLFLYTILNFINEQKEYQTKLFRNKKLLVKEEKRISLFSELNENISDVRNKIENLTNYLKYLKQEKYNFEVELDDTNILKKPLSELLLKLREDKRVFEEQIAKQQIDTIITVAIAKVNDILRENINDLSVFTYEIIKYISDLIEAIQGGFYVVYEENDHSYLELEAFYSYNRRVYHRKKIEFGEGMAGICAFERKRIISKVPDNYLEITSGLGKEKPNYVLLIPLEYNNKIYGILEFAFIHQIKKHFSDFLDNISSIIASSIATSNNNEQTKKLLEQTQKIQENTAKKERELENQLDNLSKLQKRTKKLELHSTSVFKSITSIVFYAEFDSQGHILDINDKLRDAVEFTFVEATMLTYYELFRITEVKQHEKYWAKVLKGEISRYEFQVNLATHAVYINSILSPVYDVEGEITKVIFIGIDYSELRNNEENMRKLVDDVNIKAEQINVQETEMNDFFEEFQNLTEVNASLKEKIEKTEKTNAFLSKEIEKRVNRSKKIQNKLNQKIRELEKEIRKLKNE